MESVGIISQQIEFNNVSCVTGHTVNYPDNVSIHYIRVGVFSEMYNISGRQLKRYRDLICTDKIKNEYRNYFHFTDGKYYYNENILSFRKYESKNLKQADNFCEITHSIQPFTEGLFNRVKNHTWNYACAVNYWQIHEVETCVEKMKKVKETLSHKYPNSRFSIFFTTEKNKQNHSHHNHLVISFVGADKPSINQIKNVLSLIGTITPWVDTFDQTDNYIDYITKDIHLYPDGWGILTSHQSDLNGFISGLRNEPPYVSLRSFSSKYSA